MIGLPAASDNETRGRNVLLSELLDEGQADPTRGAGDEIGRHSKGVRVGEEVARWEKVVVEVERGKGRGSEQAVVSSLKSAVDAAPA